MDVAMASNEPTISGDIIPPGGSLTPPPISEGLGSELDAWTLCPASPKDIRIEVFSGEQLIGTFEPSKAILIAEVVDCCEGDIAWETLYQLPDDRFVLHSRCWTDLNGQTYFGPAELISYEAARKWARDHVRDLPDECLHLARVADLTQQGGVTMPGRGGKRQVSQEARDLIRDALKGAGRPLRGKEISRQTGYKYGSLRHTLATLLSEGCLKRDGRGYELSD